MYTFSISLRFQPDSQIPNWEDGVSTGSLSEAEEKTIKAVCEQMMVRCIYLIDHILCDDEITLIANCNASLLLVWKVNLLLYKAGSHLWLLLKLYQIFYFPILPLRGF